MEKNVASQTWVVFAFDRSTNAPETGDAANITANLRIDGAAANAVDDTNPTELEDGYYIFDLTAAETNGDNIVISPASSTSNIQVIGCPAAVYTRPPNFNGMGIESDGDLTKVNELHGHTAQTADNNTILAHATYGNAAIETIVDGIEAAILSAISTHDGKLDTLTTNVGNLNDLSVADIIAGIADGSYDLQEMIRIMFAVLAGISNGGGGSTLNMRDSADSKNRVTATVDSDGNRTAMTLDGS